MNQINGCKWGKISVTPANWDEPDADIKKPWVISYRFTDTKGITKQILVRGMNYERKWKRRMHVTQTLLDFEEERLKKGYNPIEKAQFNRQDYIIDPRTPIMHALEKSLSRIKIEPKTKKEIAAMLVHVAKAAKDSGIDQMKVQDIRKRHIIMILEQAAKTKNWSANYYNHYRKYLSMLFKELSGIEAIEFNPVKEIAKQKTVTKVRATLTTQQRNEIYYYLPLWGQERFWLFIHIFFDSGSRETELLKVKAKDVDLKSQKVKITVIKGSQRKEVYKTIKNVVLPYWMEAIKGAGKEDYVFSEGLKPGPKTIRPEQITRRWRTHMKGKMGITADFYALKHAHTDQLASVLSIDEARKHNSHTTEKTTRIYAVNEQERQHERLKSVDITL